MIEPVDPVVDHGWTDPYTDEVLATMRAQAPLGDLLERLQDLGGSAVIGGAIDVRSNGVTVHWYGDRSAAVDAVIGEGRAAGITTTVIEAAYSPEHIGEMKRRLREQAGELGWSMVGSNIDGSFTVAFRTVAAAEAARPAIAALNAAAGSPPVYISDELSDPVDFSG